MSANSNEKGVHKTRFICIISHSILGLAYSKTGLVHRIKIILIPASISPQPWPASVMGKHNKQTPLRGRRGWSSDNTHTIKDIKAHAIRSTADASPRKVGDTVP
ncbi:Uncharacterized protein HZ326_21846 [Fusarium oxysporum f. sp. albedinis]|nr:hypothetical protein HZ326_23724 [Fusarium oxysporum f. sp. albedinis]KAJ0135119.1 Uncharacterized protein HZ326_21846 [Fusarium oxysporum f. sp. albedinis]